VRIGAFSYVKKLSGGTVNDFRGRKWGCSLVLSGQIDFTTALALPGVAGELPGHISGLFVIECARK